MKIQNNIRRLLVLTLVVLCVSGCRKKTKTDPEPPALGLLDTIEALETETEYPAEKKIWDAADETLPVWAGQFDEKNVRSASYTIQGEQKEEYTVTDKAQIRELFDALDEVTVTEKADGYARDEGDIFTFEMNDGSRISIGFCLSCFTWNRELYETQNTDRLWEEVQTIMDSAEKVTEEADETEDI